MTKIITYSILLLLGILASQTLDVSSIAHYIEWATLTFLSYIMMEVGLEFVIDTSNIKKYFKDFFIAFTAAALPWALCMVYFYYWLGGKFEDSMLVALFAAPTSAGLLFTMFGAAGLGTTWLFHRARMLAIFDDLHTIIFMIPMQMLFIGFVIQSALAVLILIVIMCLSYHYLHQLHLPISGRWLLAYSAMMVFVCEILNVSTHIELEVLLPAFAFGCILYNPHDPANLKKFAHEHAFFEHLKGSWYFIDNTVKSGFMFLVGFSLPKIDFELIEVEFLVMNVLILTLLANLGKLVPAFCYRTEATLRERIALSIAMFPRGEVGAAVLLVSIEHKLEPTLVGLGVVSLALNLVLTGFFITAVIWLIKPLHQKARVDHHA